MKTFLKALAIVVICTVAVPLAVAGTALAALFYWPTPVVLPAVNKNLEIQPSVLYDSKGNDIGEFHLYDQNIPVKASDIPQVLKDAAVASEDRNFYKHGGIDTQSIIRAAYADVTSNKIVQGGSTITQQYVRSAFLGKEQTFSRKLREAILASKVERTLSKDEILYRYLSTIYYGDGAYGIGAAAQTYFHKTPGNLNASEAALLIGVLPAPTAYAPRENPQNAESRRKEVLLKMFQQHYLDKQQYDDAVAQPVWLESRGAPPGPATVVYGPETEVPKYPYFYDYVRQYLVEKYGTDVVFRGGLKIETTIDPDLQANAEQDVQDGLKGTNPDLDMSLVSVEPQTGFVRAFVGGRDYAASQTNLALGGCPGKRTDVEVQVKPYCWDPDNKVQPVPQSGGTGRQPGSSFKPFVLATAYSEGIKPSKRYSGASYKVPHCTGKDCVIHNFGNEKYGVIDLKTATAHSVNGVYARLIQDVGFTQTAETAKKLGLTSVWYSKDVQGTSGNFGLGVTETSPLDMASAYGVFANRGLREVATPIVKVVDSKGKTLEDNTRREGTRALDSNVADNVTDALTGVITRGTAHVRGNIGRPAAGKTGTNSNNSDAWFVGYTPTLSTAVWLGYRNSRNPVILPGYGSVEGGELPTATWAKFMKQALANVPITKFNQPAPITAPADLDSLIKQRNAQQTPQSIEIGDSRTKTSIGNGNYVNGGGTVSVSPPASSTTSTTQ
jgi:membrane peptidoglycan carboxypeptidase